MSINFHPRAGDVLYCDFAGNVAPEIIKNRPVVVVCTMRRSQLVMVVPLSTTPPTQVKNYHHQLSVNPIPNDTRASWAKCDMVTTVRLARLDRIKVGKRNWVSRSIGIDDLTAIRRGVAIAAHVQLPPLPPAPGGPHVPVAGQVANAAALSAQQNANPPLGAGVA